MASPFAGRGALTPTTSCPTGPILGKGSELERLWNMPDHMGHNSGITAMTMVEDKLYTGGRDSQLFSWRGVRGPNGMSLAMESDPVPIPHGEGICSLLYEPQSKWLFCGLWNGDIQAYCKEPILVDRMAGHRRSVASLAVHASVVVSGSNDSTVRLWTVDPASRRFACHGPPLQSPAGSVHAVRVFDGALWVGAQAGITCFDLQTLQSKGTIPTQPVVGLVEFQGHMLAAFRNGDICIYNGAGVEAYRRSARGEHTTNTSLSLMMHPHVGKPMLLCGQVQGYVTAYDLPDFAPRGSFVCRTNSDVRAIQDAGGEGLFFTGGGLGDVNIWQWTNRGGGTPQVVSNPFAPTANPCGLIMR